VYISGPDSQFLLTAKLVSGSIANWFHAVSQTGLRQYRKLASDSIANWFQAVSQTGFRQYRKLASDSIANWLHAITKFTKQYLFQNVSLLILNS